MIIKVDIRNHLWYYYYNDSDGYKTTVEGFQNHLEAEENAKDKFGSDVEFIYNR